MKLFLLLFLMTLNAFAGFPQGDHEKMYKDIVQFKSDLKQIINGTVNPQSVATPGDIGSLFLADNGNAYIKQDNGTSTNWSLLSYYQLPSFVGNARKVLSVNPSEAFEEFVDVTKYANNEKKNLFLNPSAEYGDADIDFTCTNAVITESTDADVPSPKSTKGFSIVASSAGECTFTYASGAAFNGLMQTFDGYFQVSNNDLVDFQILNDSNIDYEERLIASATFKRIKRNEKFGSTNHQIKLIYSGAVTIYMDEIYTGLQPVSDVQSVSDAHFVGTVEFIDSVANDADCAEIPSSGNTWTLPDLANCDTLGTITGAVSWNEDNERTSINVSVIKGTRYVVNVTDFIYKLSGTSTEGCYTGISFDGGSTTKVIRTHAQQLATSNLFSNKGHGSAEFTATATGIINIQYRVKSDNASQCEFMTRLSDFNMSVYAYPDSSSTIVTQDTELTVNTANDFVANVSSTGVVSGENFDWINGNCTNPSTGNYTCTIISNIFAAIPVCTLTASGGDNDRLIGKSAHAISHRLICFLRN